MISFQNLAVSMLQTEQNKGQTIYQHGISVKEHLMEIIQNGMENPPSWFKYKDKIINNLYDYDILSKYALYHDCGKSFCKEVDSLGISHFPNHAQVSKEKYLEASWNEYMKVNFDVYSSLLFAEKTKSIDAAVKVVLTKEVPTYYSSHEEEIIMDWRNNNKVKELIITSDDDIEETIFENDTVVSLKKLKEDIILNENQSCFYQDYIVANLIGWDMVLHTANAVEIEEYIKKWSIKDACSLLVAALAEIQSNAKLFGGTNSTSYKIKLKQLERRGKQICKFYFGEV